MSSHSPLLSASPLPQQVQMTSAAITEAAAAAAAAAQAASNAAAISSLSASPLSPFLGFPGLPTAPQLAFGWWVDVAPPHFPFFHPCMPEGFEAPALKYQEILEKTQQQQDDVDKEKEAKPRCFYEFFRVSPQMAAGWFSAQAPTQGPFFWPAIPAGFSLVPTALVDSSLANSAFSSVFTASGGSQSPASSPAPSPSHTGANPGFSAASTTAVTNAAAAAAAGASMIKGESFAGLKAHSSFMGFPNRQDSLSLGLGNPRLGMALDRTRSSSFTGMWPFPNSNFSNLSQSLLTPSLSMMGMNAPQPLNNLYPSNSLAGPGLGFSSGDAAELAGTQTLESSQTSIGEPNIDIGEEERDRKRLKSENA